MSACTHVSQLVVYLIIVEVGVAMEERRGCGFNIRTICMRGMEKKGCPGLLSKAM